MCRKVLFFFFWNITEEKKGETLIWWQTVCAYESSGWKPWNKRAPLSSSFTSSVHAAEWKSRWGFSENKWKCNHRERWFFFSQPRSGVECTVRVGATGWFYLAVYREAANRSAIKAAPTIWTWQGRFWVSVFHCSAVTNCIYSSHRGINKQRNMDSLRVIVTCHCWK